MSVIFGFIYAQAEHFWQIEDSHIQALGRASSLRRTVAQRRSDQPRARNSQSFTSRIPEVEPTDEEICQATADGLNYFLEKNPQVKPRLITKFEPWYLLAFGQFAQYQLFIYRRAGIRDPRFARRFRKSNGGTRGRGGAEDRGSSSAAIFDPRSDPLSWSLGR